MFIRFDTTPECDRHTHTTTAYTTPSIASLGKNLGDIHDQIFVPLKK